MSRVKKKAPSVAAIDRNEVDIFDEISRLESTIADLWTDAGGQFEYLTPAQARILAMGAMSYSPQRIDARAEKQKEKARQAMNTLRAWCRFDPDDNGLPKATFQDRRLAQLEFAIHAAEPLADQSLSRQWIYCAWDLWFRVCGIIRDQGRQAGISQNSHEIKFISLVLQRVGHPTATPNAIRKELEKDTEQRDKAMAV